MRSQTFCVRFVLSFVFCLMLISSAEVFATDPVYRQQKNFEYQTRTGIGNTLAKLKSGQEVRVAYLGGSITCAQGYRVMTTDWLRKTYPNTPIKEIFAGVSGTGSRLGNYRLERDVLQYKPDLLFVEFAVNDGGQSAESIWRNIGAIVCKTWQANPQTDIVFIYTFCVPFAKTVRSGWLPGSASAMEQLAEFYGIPSINFMDRVVELEKNGKLVFVSTEKSENGKICFSKDGTHPGKEGHELYLKDIQRAFAAMSDLQPVDRQVQLQKTFVSGLVLDGKMYPVTASMLSQSGTDLSGSKTNQFASHANKSDENKSVKSDNSTQLPANGFWQKMTPTDRFIHFQTLLDTIWQSNAPGSSISFRFKGSEFGLYDVVGPDGGDLLVTVDGVRQEKPLSRCDPYCINYFSFRVTATFVASNLDPEKVHTVTLTTASEKIDRLTMLNPKMRDPAELKQPKFQGNFIRIGKLLIRGELLP